MENKFAKNTFIKRLRTMLTVDFRRMLSMPFFYIVIGSSFVIPILILVMTTMMEGTTTTDPQGNQIPMQGFETVWQAISARSDAPMSMDLTGMCNMNIMYFLIPVLACIFISGDFKSGYSKNLFTVRSKKSDYVISKTVVCFFGGALMLLAFFVGALLGGAISKLSFSTGGASSWQVFLCLLSKIAMVGVFVPIIVLVSCILKQRTWLSILFSMVASMLLFTMIQIITPLDQNIINTLVCIIGALVFSAGLGAVSNVILKNTSLV